MMADLTIRPALSADLAPMMALFRRSVREVAARDYTSAQTEAWAPDIIDPTDWASRFSTRSVWVAEADGCLAGFISLGPEGHLHMLFVHPDYQRSGVARRLVTVVEAAALRAGEISLITEASITARPFFESQGFRVVECQRISRGGQDFIRYAMEKPLLP